MSSKDPRVEGYAKALFDIAQAEDALDQVEDELFRFARTLENEIRLRDALVDPQLPVERRVEMLRELLGAKASPHTVNLISVIVDTSVVGGLVARVGDLVFDASVRRRLELAKENLGRGLDG